MKIRNKLLLATAIPITLLIVQVLLVNIFIRELQLAVQFISTSQNVIEADLLAKDQLEELRRHVKNIPQTYVQSNDSPTLIDPIWRDIKRNIELISTSPVMTSVDERVIATVQLAFAKAGDEVESLNRALTSSALDMNTLLVHAISTDSALNLLDQSLADLALELRQQLQLAVDREQNIHNRPIIAGVLIGGFAVGLLVILVWLFVDRGIVRRLTKLSQETLAIAGGDLTAPTSTDKSNDEFGKMSQALNVFRNNAIEIKEANLREIAQKRKQRQYWLEHMASFLRHELKNKQVGAEQSIRLLSSKEGGNPQVLKYCDRASSSLIEMKELINSTVDAADIESALLSEDFTVLDVQKFLRNYTDKTNERLNAGIVMINELPDQCFIRGDEHRLEQMLDKLINNAIDFKEPGTDAIIRLARRYDRQIAINIENHGPALAADTQALFRLSYSVRSVEQKRQGNVGFGLFVARRIADYHHGAIEATNTHKGPVFTICLPVHAG